MATKRSKGSGKRERNVSVRAVRRAEPDVRRLGRALIAYALAEAAAEAAAQADADRRQDQEHADD